MSETKVIYPKKDSKINMDKEFIVLKTPSFTKRDEVVTYNDHKNVGYAAYSNHTDTTNRYEQTSTSYSQSGYKAYHDHYDWSSTYPVNGKYKQTYAQYRAYKESVEKSKGTAYDNTYYADGLLKGGYEEYHNTVSGANMYWYEEIAYSEYGQKSYRGINQNTFSGYYKESFGNSGYKAYNDHTDKNDSYTQTSYSYSQFGYKAYNDHTDTSNTSYRYAQSGIYGGAYLKEQISSGGNILATSDTIQFEKLENIEDSSTFTSNKIYKINSKFKSFIENLNSNYDYITKTITTTTKLDNKDYTHSNTYNICIVKKSWFTKDKTMFEVVKKFVEILNNNLSAYECELIEKPMLGDTIDIKYINNIINKYNKINAKLKSMIPNIQDNVKTINKINPGEDVYDKIIKIITEDLKIKLY